MKTRWFQLRTCDYVISDSLRSHGRTRGRRCGNTVYPSSFVAARRQRRRHPLSPSLHPSLFRRSHIRRSRGAGGGGREGRSGAAVPGSTLSLYAQARNCRSSANVAMERGIALSSTLQQLKHRGRERAGVSAGAIKYRIGTWKLNKLISIIYNSKVILFVFKMLPFPMIVLTPKGFEFASLTAPY